MRNYIVKHKIQPTKHTGVFIFYGTTYYKNKPNKDHPPKMIGLTGKRI